MSRFKSLLLPLDGSAESAKGIGCALWLAQMLDATLHVLHAGEDALPREQALQRLCVPDAQHHRLVLHQMPTDAEAAILEAIALFKVDMVIMSARGESIAQQQAQGQDQKQEQPRSLGRVALGVAEHSPVPVLLFPSRYREVLPWRSILVAASGEAAADHALEAAAQLAAPLQLKVTVLHAGDGPDGSAAAPLGAYADAVHHEYPHRLREMLDRGLGSCTDEEARHVESAMLHCGDPAMVLLQQVELAGSSMLALGWHGAFGAGRALVFKRLLELASCPLLLMRQVEQSSVHLKVGVELES